MILAPDINIQTYLLTYTTLFTKEWQIQNITKYTYIRQERKKV